MIITESCKKLRVHQSLGKGLVFCPLELVKIQILVKVVDESSLLVFVEVPKEITRGQHGEELIKYAEEDVPDFDSELLI